MEQRNGSVKHPGPFNVSLTSPGQHHLQLQQPRAPQPSTIAGVSSIYPQDPVAAQSRMEQSLKRSVTLVFWYKAACEPIRLYQEILTFPMFQLSQFPALVADLGLSSNAYVDMYNPHSCTWEQQTISSPRYVESEQRLLYRARKSLLEGIADGDCPGIDHEISMQSHNLKASPPLSLRTSLKRPAPETEHNDSPPSASKYYRVDPFTSQNGYIASPSQYTPSSSQSYPQSLSTPKANSSSELIPSPQIQHQSPSPPQSSATSQYTPTTPRYTSLAGAVTPSSADRPPIPIHPHPPLKRWPNDYTVSEIAAGFRDMDTMISQQPTLTQKLAFERVFGCRYIKSTVCRHRAVWKKADQTIKDAYEALGVDERGVWGDFVKKVEGRGRDSSGSQQQQTQQPQQQQQQQQQPVLITPQQAGLHPPMSASSSSLSMAVMGHDVRSDKDEPVMGSLVPPPGHSLTSRGLLSGSLQPNSHDASVYGPSGTSNRVI